MVMASRKDGWTLWETIDSIQQLLKMELFNVLEACLSHIVTNSHEAQITFDDYLQGLR